MEIKVTLGFDEKAESLLNRLIAAFGGVGKVELATPKKVEEVCDVEMAEHIEESSKESIKEEIEEIKEPVKVNYAALKKEAKELGIKLVQMKKKDEVLALTKSYGYKKISDVEDKNIEAYLVDLKKIMEDE